MKKIIIRILLCVNLLSVFVLSSFSTAKAQALTPGTITTYGWYKAETYVQSTSVGNASFDFGIIGLTGLTVELPINSTSSVFHFMYQFSEPITGTMTLTITGASTYYAKDTNFAVNGACFIALPDSTNNKTKTWRFTFTNTEIIDFMIVAPASTTFNNSTTFTMTGNYGLGADVQDYVEDIAQLVDQLDTRLGQIYGILSTYFDYKLSTMDDTLVSIHTALSQQADYMIPIEMLTAYYLVDYQHTIKYAEGNVFPYYSITTNETTKEMYLQPNQVVYLYYYASVAGLTGNSNNENVTMLNEIVNVVTSSYHMKKITITNNTNSQQTCRIVWQANGRVIPVYLGDGKDMSQEMQSITKHDSETKTTGLLQQILNAIRSLTGENLYDTSTYDDAVDDAGNFLDNVVTTFPSVDSVQNDIDSLPDFDITDPDFKLDDISGFTGYVYTQMTNVFPFLKTFVLLGLAVMLMRLFL